MPQHTGNAGAETGACGERILSLSPQPQGLHQRRIVNRDSGPAPAALKNTHSHVGTFLLAHATNTPLTTNPQSVEVQAQARKQEIDKVYHITRYDLSLEGERTTTSGG